MSLFPDLPPQDWPALYAAGSSLAQIADRTGYSATRVRRELLVRGVVIRRPGVRLGSRHRLSDHRAYLARMRLPPDQPPPASPKMSAKEQRLRHEDRLKTIRLRMAIGRELDERDIISPAAIGEALGMPAAEAVKLMTRRKWREGDVARLQAAAARLGLEVPDQSNSGG